MSKTEQQYLRVRDEWITAHRNYKRNLNSLGIQQQRTGQVGPNERGFEWHFNYIYSQYQSVAKRYLQALEAYSQERPELKGRLMYDYLREASIAQNANRNDVSDHYLQSVDNMAVESARVAYADWIRNGNAETMAGVFVAITDAQLLNVENNPEIRNITQDVFDHFQQGKMKKDPVSNPVKPTPKVPSAKRQPGPALWIYKIIEY